MRRVIALFTAVLLALSVSATAIAQSEPSAWAVNEVDASAANFLKAAEGEIDYSAEITREQFAVVALNIYGAVSGVEIPQMSVKNPFTDCNNPLVVTAYGLGLVQGISENEFAPDEAITREAICTMIARMADEYTNGMDLSAFLPDLGDFKDGDAVSEWAADSVKLCVLAGLIKGTDEGKLEPQSGCTVEQALIIAKRIKNINF